MGTDYFDRTWYKRIKIMAKHIPENKSIMDLGCGNLELKKYIHKNNSYYPVDFIKRTKEVLQYNFNRREFPDLKVDICFVSGVLEYLHYPTWFINKITRCCNECIISYSTKEKFPDENFRVKNLWINNLSEDDLIKIFASCNWVMKYKNDLSYTYFIFKKME